MKVKLSFGILLVFFLNGCTSQKKDPDVSPISVIAIIKGQLNQLDTSLFQFTKLETVDGKTDTTFLKREEIRTLAKDFLSLPDITQSDYSGKYTEDRFIDESSNTLNITATAKNEHLEIQKQIIMVPLNQYTSGSVQSLYIDRIIDTKDSTLEQKLFWQMDKFFRIASIIQKANTPEKTKLLTVKWD